MQTLPKDGAWIDRRDIIFIRRFVAMVEGIALLMNNEARDSIYDYIGVIDDILDKLERGED